MEFTGSPTGHNFDFPAMLKELEDLDRQRAAFFLIEDLELLTEDDHVKTMLFFKTMGSHAVFCFPPIQINLDSTEAHDATVENVRHEA